MGLMGRERKNEWRESERERISGTSSKEVNAESRIRLVSNRGDSYKFDV